jgi:hypothetical protein
MNRTRMVLVALVAASALAAAGARGDVIDKGSFRLHLKDRLLGVETFDIEEAQDSLLVRARQYLTVPTTPSGEPLEKGADILIGRYDYALRQYHSTRNFRGKTTGRGLVIADTHYVAYREGEGIGDGESRVLPPGRLFVMDSQVITLFDLLCRSMNGTSFVSRPVNLLALGPRDTMLDARAVVLGSETIRWGARPVVARKLQLVADSQTTFTLWVGAQGQLLRLTEPVSGLRVERDAPAIKRPPRPKPTPEPPGKPGG